MTNLPTFAECAAVPPEKRTALQNMIWDWTHPLANNEKEIPFFRKQLAAVIEEERARCDAIIARQGRAAIAGMNAAKEISGHQLQQAAKLRAESNPDALESERAMNAILTEENEALRKERDALAARIAEQDAQIESLQNKWATRPLSIRDCDALEAENERLRNALHLAYDAMRAPLDGWKGELERRAMDAYHAALAKGPTT